MIILVVKQGKNCGNIWSSVKSYSYLIMGQAVEQLVEALRYKPQGRRFDSRLAH